MAAKSAASKPEAPEKRPAKEKPAYALTTLTHWPHLFSPGDRIDELIPAGIVADIVARGDGTHTKPEE